MTLATESAVDLRQAFVARVADRLTEAGVEYVLLHAYGRVRSADSDVDVVVARPSLALADACIRSGVLGRVVQSLHYDIPWCHYYVLDSHEFGRRYRQLDIACDPWGIGRYGAAPSVVLAHARTADGLRVPEPAAETLYLAAKRAQKGSFDPADARVLVSSFEQDPDGASSLLEATYGAAGRRVAEALVGSGELSAALAELRLAVVRGRRTPAVLARRAVFSSARLARRLAKPSGLVVVLAGPDGVGKSTLADRLERELPGAFRRVSRLHCGPSVLPPPARLLGRQAADGSEPHGREPSGFIGSALRLGWLSLDSCLGWPAKMGFPRRRATAIVVERGALDLAIDPRRYRLSLPWWLIHATVRLLPRADLTLVLDASPARVLLRSDELSHEELVRQRDAWRQVAARDAGRFRVLDADVSPDLLLEGALDAVDDRLASRQPDSGSLELAFRCLGRPTPHGLPYSVVTGGGRARWVIPAGAGSHGPASLGLYRPAGARHAAAATVLELRRLGLVRSRVRLAPESGIGRAIACELGVREVGLAAALTGEPARGQRVLFAVRSEGRTVAFAKVSSGTESTLVHEQRVLEALGSVTERFVVPRVLGALDWHGRRILLLEPLDVVGRATRAIGHAEFAALEELNSLRAELAGVLALSGGLSPLHGDFTPWNCGQTRDGRLALWDWESARVGFPLEDVFHWEAQQLFYVRHGCAEELVAAALSPDAGVRQLCERLQLDDRASINALRAYLIWSLAEPSLARDDAVDERRRALRLLEEAMG